jgi:hypothetical protein
MKYVLLCLTGFMITSTGRAQTPSAEQQVTAAVSAAPEHLREQARVYGYDDSGGFVTLREGSNEMVCLADTPGDENFSAACYHNSLEPFMARGRALRAEGMDRAAVTATREEEIASGDLAFPDGPATLYVRYGDAASYNYDTGDYSATQLRYVVYTPYATPETTGLSPNPSPGAPWIMFPGKPTAHIMIMPAAPGS